MTSTRTISVLIPCYNEQETIVELLELVRAQNVDGVDIEVVVVDDGSNDRTPKLLAQRPDLYDHVVFCERNGGKGAAVRRGLLRCTGTHVLFQDADLEYDPSDYARLMAPVVNHEADVVFGSRLTAPPCSRVAYYWHRVGNKLLTLTFNVLNNTTFSDIYSCYFLFRRDLLSGVELKIDGWAQQAEILGLVVHRAKRMYEVPVSYYGRTYEEGKKIRWYHAASVLRTITSTRVLGRRRLGQSRRRS